MYSCHFCSFCPSFLFFSCFVFCFAADEAAQIQLRLLLEDPIREHANSVANAHLASSLPLLHQCLANIYAAVLAQPAVTSAAAVAPSSAAAAAAPSSASAPASASTRSLLLSDFGKLDSERVTMSAPTARLASAAAAAAAAPSSASASAQSLLLSDFGMLDSERVTMSVRTASLLVSLLARAQWDASYARVVAGDVLPPNDTDAAYAAAAAAQLSRALTDLASALLRLFWKMQMAPTPLLLEYGVAVSTLDDDANAAYAAGGGRRLIAHTHEHLSELAPGSASRKKQANALSANGFAVSQRHVTFPGLTCNGDRLVSTRVFFTADDVKEQLQTSGQRKS